jgi:ribosomal-protein-alanine N-acetyltransferase
MGNELYQLNLECFDVFPILKTDRLTLRDIRKEDAEAIFKMRSNKNVNRFISRPDMQDPDLAADLAERTINAWKDRKAIGWAGVLRDQGAIVGTCGFNNIDFYNLRAEIGGELDVEHWGKHIAVEAVSAIVNYGFDVMKLHSIEAKVSPENRGAIALMEHLGFKKEAHYKDRIYFKGHFSDMAVYTLIR